MGIQYGILAWLTTVLVCGEVLVTMAVIEWLRG